MVGQEKWALRSQLLTISGHGTGASTRETVETGDVVIGRTYKTQNNTFRALDVFIIPLTLDPGEAYGRIEDCAFKLAAEQ